MCGNRGSNSRRRESLRSRVEAADFVEDAPGEAQAIALRERLEEPAATGRAEARHLEQSIAVVRPRDALHELRLDRFVVAGVDGFLLQFVAQVIPRHRQHGVLGDPLRHECERHDSR